MTYINPTNPSESAKITIMIDVDGKRRSASYAVARNVHSEEQYNYSGTFMNPRDFLSSAEVSLRFRAMTDLDTGIWSTVEFSDLNEQGLDDKFDRSRWWRAIDRDGDMMAETSNPKEFKHLGLTDIPGMKFQQLWLKTENVWVDTNPFEEDAG